MNNNFLENLGNNIRSFRELNKLSQHQLAKLANVSHVSVCKWEQGKTDPTCTNIYTLAKIFNVTIDELILLNNETFNSNYKFQPIIKKFFETIYNEDENKITIEIKK